MKQSSGGGKRRRPKGKQAEEPALSPAQQLREALEELRDRQQRRKRRRGGKRRHIDDYRELVLDESVPGKMTEALIDLTQAAHRDRRRLVGDEKRRIELPRELGEGKGTDDPQQRAARAAQALREAMRKKGVAERTHYYPASARSQTGEIDRTYSLDTRRRRRRPPSRS